MRNLSLPLLGILLLCACGSPDKTAENTTPAAATPVFASKNPEAFNQSFDQLFSSYFSLRDAFVEYDTAGINRVSGSLATAAADLKIDALKDSAGVAQNAGKYSDTVRRAAAAIAGQPVFEKKQRAFQAISDAMYELARTVRYDKSKIFHQHCPMAFNNEGAYWISNSNEIVNPYMGKKHPKYRSAMLECGDIPDSLHYGN